MSDIRRPTNPSSWDVLARADVLSGLLFIAIAALGLWISRDYPVGTSLRMGTGYVPRLLCWVLLALGACVLVQGLREAPSRQGAVASIGWRPLVLVTAGLALFGLTLERLGLVLAILLLTIAGAYATRGRGIVETLLAALLLIALSWGIFIAGLGLAIPLWPDF